MIGVGIGLPFYRVFGGIDAQAQAHFDRVIADGGLVPSGLSGVNAFFTTIKTIYATSDITTAISVGLDAQVLGYKLGAGAGTTAGQAAQKLYSCSGASGDVVQTTAASQPLLLVHEGANYWFGSGVNGNFVSTPNAAANQITGDIEIIAKVTLNSTDLNWIISKRGGSSENIAYEITVDNKTPSFQFSLNGTNVLNLSANFQIDLNVITWIKATRSTSGLVSIYTSTNGTNFTLRNSQNLGGGSLFNANSVVRVGTMWNNVYNYNGKIYRVTIADSISPTPLTSNSPDIKVDFNPNQYNAATSQTQWTSSTGEVWTINTGTATTGYKGVLVDRTIVQGDGIDDRIVSSAFASLSSWTNYFAYKGYTGNGSGRLVDDITNFQNNDVVLGTTTVNCINNQITVPSRIINLTSFLVYQKTLSGTSSLAYQNTNTPTTGTFLAGYIFTGVALFSAQFAAGYGNALLGTYILGGQVDNSTTRTAMYNYIRSINNNAF